MRIREKLAWGLLTTLGLLVIASLASVARSGPLDPPAPPASTLPQVEPRIPISSLPFIIDTPGSYFLTRNLYGSSGESGVLIGTNDVELDLNGFTLSGAGGSVDGVATRFDAPFANIAVRNGTIAFWGDDGIDLAVSSNIRIDGVTAAGNAGSGIETGMGTVSDCIVTGPPGGTVGVRAFASATISNCVVDGYGTGLALNGGGIIRDCVVKNARFTGIFAGARSTITNCRVREVGAFGPGPNNGITVEGTALVKDNVIEDIINSVLPDNAIAVAGMSNVITGNVLNGAETGLYVGATASNTKAYGNTFGAVTTYMNVVGNNGGGDDLGPTRPYGDGFGAWDQKLPASGSDNCNTPRFKCVIIDESNPPFFFTGGVLDRETGLVWTRVAFSTRMGWQEAMDFCEGLGMFDRFGWRLPSIYELKTIVDESPDHMPDGHPFYSVPSGLYNEYWSSTIKLDATGHPGLRTHLWLQSPELAFEDVPSTQYSPWCVRGPGGAGG